MGIFGVMKVNICSTSYTQNKFQKEEVIHGWWIWSKEHNLLNKKSLNCIRKCNNSLDSLMLMKLKTLKYLAKHQVKLKLRKLPNIDWSNLLIDTGMKKFYFYQWMDWNRNLLIMFSKNFAQNTCLKFLWSKWGFMNINGKKEIFLYGTIGKWCTDHQVILKEEDFSTEHREKKTTIELIQLFIFLYF